ncbi:MAG: hypothetical protein LBI92_06905 [Azoarcus sp.]|jgi:hypothetical protein|nr:hypothetical protein [Azoarcus sp.]
METISAAAAEDIIVTFEHLHAMGGHCHSGIREFCRRYGLDWGAALKRGGFLASEALATGDALAIAAVNFARKMGHGQR